MVEVAAVGGFGVGGSEFRCDSLFEDGVDLRQRRHAAGSAVHLLEVSADPLDSPEVFDAHRSAVEGLNNGGNAVNFVHGAVVGPFLHLVQAEILAAAARLAEGDLASLSRIDESPLHIDVHRIPDSSSEGEPEHWHADFCYAFTYIGTTDLALQDEEVSDALWVSLDEIADRTLRDRADEAALSLQR